MSAAFKTLNPVTDQTLAALLFSENGDTMDVLWAIHADWLAGAQDLSAPQMDTPQREDFIGGPGSDTFEPSSGTDRFFGQQGDDTLLLANGNIGSTGDEFYGGSGVDRIQLAGAGTASIAAASIVGFFEENEFLSDGMNISKTLILDSSQLDDPNELGSVLIDGNTFPGADDDIVVEVTSVANVDLSP